ncbi:MAG: sortase [Ruminococcaceae bacterium]|nr:sortase [Oscillospiraceae bacterium]
MAKRNSSIILLLIGCILLLIAGGWYIYNILEDKNAGKQAEKILSQLDNAQNSINKDSAPVITVGGDAFCGKVTIEKLGVELPVYDEWDYNRLETAPCRYTGSIETNDLIIAAHNYKSHFGSLDKLQNGDEIIFTDAYGTAHSYEVCELILLDKTAVSDMQSGGWDFTLFTCTKNLEYRVTVRCIKK